MGSCPSKLSNDFQADAKKLKNNLNKQNKKKRRNHGLTTSSKRIFSYHMKIDTERNKDR